MTDDDPHERPTMQLPRWQRRRLARGSIPPRDPIMDIWTAVVLLAILGVCCTGIALIEVCT